MIEKYTLANGIRLIIEDLPYLRSVSIGVWVLSGSCDENKDISGISHFLEHMLFKGTEKRTAKQIAEELDNVGGELQAFTSREFTCYSARVLDNHLSRALDVLQDIVVHSTLPEEEIQKEKGVVLEEISMYEDTPNELVHDLFTSSIWQGHPIGLSILGTEQNVKNFSRELLVDYYKKHYSSNNIVISVAGNFNKEFLIKEVERLFGGLDKQNLIKNHSIPETCNCISIVNRKLEQVHFCMGTKGLSFTHPRRFALYLLNSILGGSMSSRLFQNVREKYGLVYNIYSYQSSYCSTGIFSIYAGTKENNFEKVLEIILNEMHKLKNELPPSQDELFNVKEQLKGGITLNFESTESRMGHLAKSEIYFNQHVGLDEIFKSIDAVKMDDMLEIANMIFSPDKMAFVAIGPLKEKMKDKVKEFINTKL